MSGDQEQRETPPDLSGDNDDPMFESALSPATVDISLSGDDDDEESPFGEPTSRTKTPTTTTNTVESYDNNEENLFQQDKAPTTTKNTVESYDDNEEDLFQQNKTPVDVNEDDQDIFGINNNAPPLVVPPEVPIAVPEAQPRTPIKQESELFPADSNVNTPQPVRSTAPFESQLSSSKKVSKSNFSEVTTASKPVQKGSNENNIEITVSDPSKVGEGMSSYMIYRISTKTTLSLFKKSEFTVNRRFSDFLGLHTKLVQKYLHLGIIVPSPPEKDSLSMAKVKISKEEAVPTDFIDRRRSQLERYLNRIVQHQKLIEDSDVREFIEMPNDLPKSTNTQALSGAGVLRVFSSISSQVTKLTAKANEQDQWFEEKLTFVLDLHTHLKHLYNQFNTLFTQRKEAGHTLKQFSTSLNHLATVEEHPLLSGALTELANLEEKLDQVNNEHVLKEYSLLTDLVKEYITLLDMVQLAFQERIKSHQQWLHAEDTLKKKRETKTKLEQTPKGADKLPQAEMEIVEWEGKVIRGKEDFERISTTIKQEIDVFEQTRTDDFKKAIDNYLKNLLEQQEKILQIWEAYLPEANKINV